MPFTRPQDAWNGRQGHRVEPSVPSCGRRARERAARSGRSDDDLLRGFVDQARVHDGRAAARARRTARLATAVTGLPAARPHRRRRKDRRRARAVPWHGARELALRADREARIRLRAGNALEVLGGGLRASSACRRAPGRCSARSPPRHCRPSVAGHDEQHVQLVARDRAAIRTGARRAGPAAGEVGDLLRETRLRGQREGRGRTEGPHIRQLHRDIHAREAVRDAHRRVSQRGGIAMDDDRRLPFLHRALDRRRRGAPRRVRGPQPDRGCDRMGAQLGRRYVARRARILPLPSRMPQP